MSVRLSNAVMALRAAERAALEDSGSSEPTPAKPKRAGRAPAKKRRR